MNINPNELRTVPVPALNDDQTGKLMQWADQILAEKRKNKESDTRELERKIDALVYGAFRLEPAEVKIVEEAIPA